MNDAPPFTVEIADQVAWLTLSRPEKRNAMSFDFFTRLPEHFARFDADPEVRVVVVAAEGKSFTAGIDLMEAGSMLADSSAKGRDGLQRKIMELQQSINAIERCRKPVIAAIHGHCVGGGVDLVCACDIRLAAADAIFSIRETRIAIVADLGTLQRLPHIIGDGHFRELAYTGRDFTATEALSMGFVNRVLADQRALREAAAGLAAEIAANPPLAVQGVKDVVLYSRAHGVTAGLHYVAQKNAAALPCEDLMEAVAAFMEKRVPVFKGN
ncbi:MAG: crotonase/enoyl-CoA hydratase family protein [Pseudomonadota bacterium]